MGHGQKRNDLTEYHASKNKERGENMTSRRDMSSTPPAHPRTVSDCVLSTMYIQSSFYVYSLARIDIVVVEKSAFRVEGKMRRWILVCAPSTVHTYSSDVWYQGSGDAKQIPLLSCCIGRVATGAEARMRVTKKKVPPLSVVFNKK